MSPQYDRRRTPRSAVRCAAAAPRPRADTPSRVTRNKAGPRRFSALFHSVPRCPWARLCRFVLDAESPGRTQDHASGWWVLTDARAATQPTVNRTGPAGDAVDHRVLLCIGTHLIEVIGSCRLANSFDAIDRQVGRNGGLLLANTGLRTCRATTPSASNSLCGIRSRVGCEITMPPLVARLHNPGRRC